MKLIIFDFDGVLIDTLSICFSLNEEIHKDLSLKEYKSFFEGNIYNNVKRFDGTPKNYRSDFDEQYKIKTRELKVPQELKVILQDLSLKYTLVIISSTPTPSIKGILDHENILLYFKDILGSDVHKSKILKIQMIFKKYNLSSKDIVFITDTLGDIKEAKKCDVKSIAVTWGFHDKSILEKGNPFRIIDNPQELIGVIEDLLK